MVTANRAITRAAELLQYCSMAVLFLMALIMFADIVLRHAAGIYIPGTYEITEMGMIVVIFGGLAHTQALKGHVRITMFVEKLPPAIRKITEGAFLVITALVCACAAWSGFVQAAAHRSRGATTAVLELPLYPFAYFMAIGLTLFAVVFIVDAGQALTRKMADKTSAGAAQGPAPPEPASTTHAPSNATQL